MSSSEVFSNLNVHQHLQPSQDLVQELRQMNLREEFGASAASSLRVLKGKWEIYFSCSRVTVYPSFLVPLKM